jgi:hypothetical protein
LSGENVTSFVLENTGNINCSFFIQTNRNAHDMFNSSSNTNEQYKIKVSNRESGACSGGSLNTWIDVNKSAPGTKYCNQFSYLNSSDEVFIDILLTVPYDIQNLGFRFDVVTITANVAI